MCYLTDRALPRKGTREMRGMPLKPRRPDRLGVLTFGRRGRVCGSGRPLRRLAPTSQNASDNPPGGFHSRQPPPGVFTQGKMRVIKSVLSSKSHVTSRFQASGHAVFTRCSPSGNECKDAALSVVQLRFQRLPRLERLLLGVDFWSWELTFAHGFCSALLMGVDFWDCLPSGLA